MSISKYLQPVTSYSALNLIWTLLRLTNGVYFDRVFFKFKENNYEKANRLLELHKFYTQKVASAPDDEEDDGFFTLQLIDFVIVFLLNLEDDELGPHLQRVFELNNIDVPDLKKIAQSYIKTFGLDQDQDDITQNVPQKDFKTVSQNPSESESEETSKHKRVKVGESEEVGQGEIDMSQLK